MRLSKKRIDDLKVSAEKAGHELTWCFIKPHVNDPQQEVEWALQEWATKNNVNVVEAGVVSWTDADVREHWKHCKGRDFFEPMVAMLAGENTLYLIFAGEGVCEKLREFVGPTLFKDTQPGQLRYMFGKASNQSFENIVHAAATPKEALEEMYNMSS